MTTMPGLATEETSLLRGKVRLLQPVDGPRASLDTVFLAAAVEIKDGDQALEIGCGVGSVSLCITSRNDFISLIGIDIQDELIQIANKNVQLNEKQSKCHFIAGDIRANPEGITDNTFDVVFMNPPYHADSNPAPAEGQALAHHEGHSGTDLKDWVKYAHRKLKQAGRLTLIHRADRLDDIIRTLTERRWFGSLVVIPLYPKAGESAKRVIVRARKERYAPLVLKAGIILHNPDGSYTAEAEAVLSDGAAL